MNKVIFWKSHNGWSSSPHLETKQNPGGAGECGVSSSTSAHYIHPQPGQAQVFPAQRGHDVHGSSRGQPQEEKRPQLQVPEQQQQHLQQLNIVTPMEEGQIYDKAIIKPAYSQKSSTEEAKEAVKKITEKYDSLGRNGMGLLKAYTESQNEKYQHQRSRSYDSILDNTTENDFQSPPFNPVNIDITV